MPGGHQLVALHGVSQSLNAIGQQYTHTHTPMHTHTHTHTHMHMHMHMHMQMWKSVPT
jgi:hypothetical protein